MPKALKIQALELVWIVLSCLDNTEAFAHYAPAVSGKASCAGETLSCGAGDSEGGVALTAKANARIGGGVLTKIVVSTALAKRVRLSIFLECI